MKTATGPFPMETTYTWQEIDENRTRMILRNKGIPSGFSKFFTLFMPMRDMTSQNYLLHPIHTALLPKQLLWQQINFSLPHNK